jgi:hypothetical protein
MFQPTDDVRAVRFDFLKAVVPRQFAGSWPNLFGQLCISREMYRKERRALWSPVIYAPNSTRANRNVQAVTCLVVDMDGEAFDHARLDGLEYLAYTTWSHTPEDQHWHLVLPLKHPVPAHRWQEVWTSLHERINVVGDPATKDPARIFYLPQHRPGTVPDRRTGFGEMLDPKLDEVFVAPRFGQVRPIQSAPRRIRTPMPKAADPKWWDTPVENSRYAGLTDEEAAIKFAERWEELKKVLLAAE